MGKHHVHSLPPLLCHRLEMSLPVFSLSLRLHLLSCWLVANGTLLTSCGLALAGADSCNNCSHTLCACAYAVLALQTCSSRRRTAGTAGRFPWW